MPFEPKDLFHELFEFLAKGLVGPKVSTYMLLLDYVEVQGHAFVLDDWIPSGQPVGARAGFALQLDEQHQYLLTRVPGCGGFLHCTAVLPPPSPPPQPATFGVQNRPGDPGLRVGDHVRVGGRLWLANDNPNLGTRYDSGALQRTETYLALQLSAPTALELVSDSPPQPNQAAVDSVTVVAPLYEYRYVEDWQPNQDKNVAGCVYVNSTGSNYHNDMTATRVIRAPALPAAFQSDATLVAVEESVLCISSGLAVSDVRRLTTQQDGVEVAAQVAPPTPLQVDGLSIADPAKPVGFSARYRVTWKPRLVAQASTVNVSGYTNESKGFTITLTNIGPDDLQITRIQLDAGPDNAFRINFAQGTAIPARATVSLPLTFSPSRDGTDFAGSLTLFTNDPSGASVHIALTGSSEKNPKESKDTKDPPDNKNAKDPKDNKDAKDPKDKDKEHKDSKDDKDNKEHKDSKDDKDNKDDNEPKPAHKLESKEALGFKETIQDRDHTPFPGNALGVFLGPAQPEGAAIHATGKAFIRPDERPEVGGPALNEPLDERSRQRRQSLPCMLPPVPDVRNGGLGVTQ